VKEVPAHSRKLKHRVERFLAKPWREKIATAKRRVRGQREAVLVPVRLPFGALWLARDDHVGRPVAEGQFELAETAFVERWLQPGMTVLDIGAHHGYYSLLASRRVGSGGHVFAFEPSARERKALREHLKMNGCRNVVVEELALGCEEKAAELYVVQGSQTGCNSLRKPIIESTAVTRKVQVRRLDDWLEEQKIARVDFIKLDVEGGELDVLKGAEKLLGRRPRPVVLAEVQDLRTEPWGYRAKEIIEYLRRKGFTWFEIAADGTLAETDVSAKVYDGNGVACPAERLEQLQALRQTIKSEESAPAVNGQNLSS
jgi:FkbM family methyltransferase